ncbi:MAG: hypothetical protein LBC07_01040 [Elusimicrobiota bacterium]|jgi:hypothetical protein|nr:hypothetical protein [Elusimicrobiota bacterium]
MNANKTNNQLIQLYEKYYPVLSEKIVKFNKSMDLQSKQKAANPLLLQVNDEYTNADLKIMIFGQEAVDWGGTELREIKKTNEMYFVPIMQEKNIVNLLCQFYGGFFLSGKCYKYTRGFWGQMKKIKNQLAEKMPHKKTAYLYNNVLKISKSEWGKPSREIIDIEKTQFNVIEKEIQIVKPDVLLFFSGPNYDGEIELTFKNSNILKAEQSIVEPFKLREFRKFDIANMPPAFRTYHPNCRLKNKQRYYNTLVDKICEMYNI